MAIILLLSTGIYAQDSEVLAVIEQLFHAMEKSDSQLAKLTLSEDAVLYTISADPEGRSQRKKSPASALTLAFGKERTDTWREPTWNEIVRVNGDLAMVWTDYAFYVNERLSHCGVDVFLLEKTPGGWKIFSITDTRHTRCKIPEVILQESKNWKK